MIPSKQELLEELAQLLRADIEAAEHARRETVAGATHEEARPENDKDTRALEQSYLAHGQARRVEQLRLELAEVLALPSRAFPEDAPIALGALIEVEEQDVETPKLLLVAPARGGTELRGGVQVITPSAPLGRSFLGKRAGDDCEVRLPQRTRGFSIVRVW